MGLSCTSSGERANGEWLAGEMVRFEWLAVCVTCVWLGAGVVRAQQNPPSSLPSSQRKLAFLIRGFLDDSLQGVENPLRSGLQAALNPSFASINSAVGTSLSNLPTASSASAVRFTFDPELGVYAPSAQSLGPILTERAETIGKDKYFFAVTFQRFQFDRLDQVDFRRVRLAIPFEIPAGGVIPFPIPGVVDADASLNLTVAQTTAHFTYGVTHWLDASYAFPIVTSTLRFSAGATFRELLSGQAVLTLRVRTQEASSTGLGDGVVRVKARVLDRSGLAVSVATDVRLPTGDEFNFHGAGAYGVKPFVIASFTRKSISPHLNAGYQWNGKSVLASPLANEPQQLPGQVFYTGGIEAAVSPRVTLAFDILNQVVIHGRRSFVKAAGVYTVLDFPNQTRQESSAAIGVKAQLRPSLIMTGNLLFRLNDSGLRARVVPMVGLSYSF